MPNTCQFTDIAFPVPMRQCFTYRIPQELSQITQPGCRVYAPFGKRNALGFVARVHNDEPTHLKSVKSIFSVVDQEPLFGEELFSFLRWVADYYLVSFGETCAAAYPFSPSVKPRMVKVVILDDQIQSSGIVPQTVNRDNQRKVLEFLINRKALLSPSDIVKEVGVSPSTIKTLEKNGLVKIGSMESLRNVMMQFSNSSQHDVQHTEEQIMALETINQSLQEKNPKPILIQGVTGSGKTEVYLSAIESALAQNKTALVMIPEISLTPQTMDRFRSRFGDQVGILHSGLGQGERFDEWRMARQGKRKIIVGTRSAVFAPLENPGIIIVDEEHEGSYKQFDPNPRYHGRDLAVTRASLCGALCILGSATPAVESTFNARNNKYRSIMMTKRISTHGMSKVELIDMRGRTEEEEILSNELKEALWQRFDDKQQAILFLNRRGYSTSVMCKHCGYIMSCDHCSVPLVYHQSRRQMLCHHCEYKTTLPEYCPSCNEKMIQHRGFGTEKVAEEVNNLISDAKVLRLDRDVTARKGEHDRLLTIFKNREADVLVGTQMIAKGLDFPAVSLVGVINADNALSLPDFRAAERTFTQLTQVAGRAGRGEYAGEVFIQSYCPDHYSVQLALQQNYDQFYDKEIRYRRLIGFPPFSRLVLWRIEGINEAEARGRSWDLYHILSEGLQHETDVTILPPVEAPLYRLRDHFRWQVALKSRDHKAFRPLLNSESLQKLLSQRRQGLRIIQDVDPWDML